MSASSGLCHSLTCQHLCTGREARSNEKVCRNYGRLFRYMTLGEHCAQEKTDAGAVQCVVTWDERFLIIDPVRKQGHLKHSAGSPQSKNVKPYHPSLPLQGSFRHKHT